MQRCQSAGILDSNCLLVNGAPAQDQLLALKGRLKTAIAGLRAQCSMRSSDAPSVSFEISNREKSGSSDRSESLSRTRELNKLLMQAKAREAGLHDEIDKLKCEILNYKYRIEELESTLDQWRYNCEMEESRCERLPSAASMEYSPAPYSTRFRKPGSASAPASFALSSSFIPDISGVFKAAHHHAPPVFQF